MATILDCYVEAPFNVNTFVGLKSSQTNDAIELPDGARVVAVFAHGEAAFNRAATAVSLGWAGSTAGLFGQLAGLTCDGIDADDWYWTPADGGAYTHAAVTLGVVFSGLVAPTAGRLRLKIKYLTFDAQ